MDDFVPLTTTVGIEAGGMKAATIDDHEMLVAHIGDEYFIADALCPHMGGRLPDGTLAGTVLTCPRHHSQFDLRDGRVLRWTDWEGVKLDVGKLLRHPRPLRTYAVKIEGDNILVGPENAPPVGKSTKTHKRFSSRLIEKIPRVEDIVSFRFERPEGYEFLAGQWFNITFSGPKELWTRQQYTQHFSHSNSPLDSELEFTTRLRGSELKDALDALPVGEEVLIERPHGDFTLPDDVTKVAFITGGIGITCVRSILRWLADSQDASASAPRSIVLLFANRSEDSVPFRGELEELETRLPGLRVVHVISQPKDTWEGYRGHIDRAVLSRELPQPSSWSYYVSGPPTFGQSMQEQLVASGVESGSIKGESFDGY